MNETLIKKCQNEHFLIDNSMNDDSFLNELLQCDIKMNKVVNNSSQKGQKMLFFEKDTELQNLIQSPIKQQVDKKEEQSDQQIIEQIQQMKTNVNSLSLNISQHKQKDTLKNGTQSQVANKKQTIHQQNQQIKQHENHFSKRKPLKQSSTKTQSKQNQAKQKQINPKQIQSIKPKEIQSTKLTIQSQNKKNKQKIIQQQKQKLQKLRQQNQNFLEIKKQNDKKINSFKNQLKDLISVKQKQIIKNQQKAMLQQIEQHKKNDQKFYEAMKQQKLAMIRKFQEMKIKQLQQEKQKLKNKQKQKIQKQSVIDFDEIRRNQEEIRKINELRDFLKSRSSYQQKVNNLKLQLMKQKPKPVKKKSQLQIKSEERRLNVKSLSAVQIYRMGQQFMQEAHLLISPQLIQKSKVSLDQLAKQMRESSRTDYKDYLKESQLKRSSFSQSTGKLSSNPEIRELKNLIIKQENSSDKLLKAKLLSVKMDKKISSKVNTKLKADSIALKLKIIEEFS